MELHLCLWCGEGEGVESHQVQVVAGKQGGAERELLVLGRDLTHLPIVCVGKELKEKLTAYHDKSGPFGNDCGGQGDNEHHQHCKQLQRLVC